MQVGDYVADQCADLGRDIDGNLFVRKIDGRFKQGGGTNQALPPGFGAPSQIAGQNAKRLAALRFRFRVDQIGESFDLRQIELPVFEGATGEFTGIRGAQTVHPAQRVKQGRDDGITAVGLELDAVFACKAVVLAER